MDKEVICEVLSRLIGYTMPCGDKDVDTVRRINNYNLVYVTKQCVETLIENAAYQNDIGEDSRSALEMIHNMTKAKRGISV